MGSSGVGTVGSSGPGASGFLGSLMSSAFHLVGVGGAQYWYRSNPPLAAIAPNTMAMMMTDRIASASPM